jgi:lycopene elongase/hydratase (dihydrobisanhydrobacterioruberin-forming)
MLLKEHIKMNFKKLIKISRPRFWLYLAGPYLLGFFFGLSSLQQVSWQFFYTLFFFLLPANIYLYGINDYFDRDTDAFNKKKSQKEHRLQKKETITLTYWLVVSVVLMIPLFFISNLGSVLILIAWFFLSTMYSAPPRFKAIPFLDFLSNILYVMPAFYAYYSLTNSLPSLNIILASFVWVWAMHLYSAIPDIVADKKAKLKTSATVLGEKTSIWLCTFFWLIFAVIISVKIFPFGLITAIYPLLGVYTFINIKKIEKIYWYYPYITAILGFLCFWYVLIPLI